MSELSTLGHYPAYMFELVASFFGFLFDAAGTNDPSPEQRAHAAYKAAWKAGWELELPLENRDDTLLVKAMKEKSVPGAYNAPGPPQLDVWFEAWRSSTTPKEARALAKTRRKSAEG